MTDKGYMIRQVETGIVYSEAVDVESSEYTYEETSEKIDDGSTEMNEEDKASI